MYAIEDVTNLSFEFPLFCSIISGEYGDDDVGVEIGDVDIPCTLFRIFVKVLGLLLAKQCFTNSS